MHAPFTRLVRDLGDIVPFVAPEAHERRLGRTFKLRLGANESAFGVSPIAQHAMVEAMEHVDWYGDPESFELRTQLACVHGVSVQNLVVGSGIDDLLCLIARTYIDSCQSVVMSLGGYPTFRYFVRGCGGTIHDVAYLRDSNDLDGLAKMAARTGARIVYLANPDNPTGTWQTAGDLQEFARRLPESCLLVLDEAYAEFAPAEAIPPIDGANPNILRLRTFSKAYGMAGTRIGYAIAARETIVAFDRIRVHFGVNRIAQAGALGSLRDPQFALSVARAVAEGRRDYEMLARELGLSTVPSATNFVAIDMGSFDRARATVDALFAHGVFVRMANASPVNRCIRVTVDRPARRATFAAILREVVASEATLQTGWPTSKTSAVFPSSFTGMIKG